MSNLISRHFLYNIIVLCFTILTCVTFELSYIYLLYVTQFVAAIYVIWIVRNTYLTKMVTTALHLISGVSILTLAYLDLINYDGMYLYSVFVFTLLSCCISISLLTKHNSPETNNQYQLGKFFYISIFLIILISTAFRLDLSTKSVPDNDEGYTYTVNLGYKNYGELGVSQTGVTYPRSQIYHFFNYTGSVFTDNNLQSIRIFNIVYFAFFSILLVFLLLKVLKNESLVLLTFLIINLNWYVNAIVLAGRSYIFSTTFSILTILLLTIATNKIREGKNYIPYLAIALALTVANFFEGHITATYHLIPLYGLFLLFALNKVDIRHKIYLLISMIFMLGSLITYITVINPSFGRFILKVLNFSFEPRYYLELGSFISYLPYLGMLIIFIAMVYVFIKKNTDTLFINLLFFIPVTYIAHITLLAKDTRFIAYLSDMIIPILIILSYLIYQLLISINNKTIQAVGVIVFFIYCLSNLNSVKSVDNRTVSWRLNTNMYENIFNQVEDNNIILTDQPLLANFSDKNNLQVYVLFRWMNDGEISDTELNLDVEYRLDDIPRVFSESEKTRFKKYLDDHIHTTHIISYGQLYHIYTGRPMIMNLEHLSNIIRNNPNKKIFLLFGHTAHDKKAIDRNPELYRAIMEAGDIKFTKVHSPEYNYYNNEKILNPKDLLTFGEILH